MFKQIVCDCRINYEIEPLDPLLIRSGTAQGVDMAFVETYRNGKEEPYLPGSSLKGVFRSHSERIATTLNREFKCNPFAKKYFCGELFKSNEKLKKIKKASYNIYKYSCPICKIFGSTAMASRIAFGDAYLEGKSIKETRDGVGIDRFTGGAANRAKFNMEVLTKGLFQGVINIENFELWQLGLLAFLFQDLEDGYIKMGMGTSRGLGRVKGKINEFTISYFSPNYNEEMGIIGVAELVDEPNYGFVQNDQTIILDSLKVESKNYGLRKEFVLTNDYLTKSIVK